MVAVLLLFTFNLVLVAVLQAVLRIRIHVFLSLLDPDPLVRGMDPDPGLDPSIIKQKLSGKP
jgi:hypothetical protein